MFEIEEVRVKFVTIGPYHRYEILEFGEIDKWRIVDMMIRSFGLNISTFFESMAMMEKEILICYADGSFQDSTDMFEMMLLDSCFIIFVLKCYERNLGPLQVGELFMRRSRNQQETSLLIAKGYNLAKKLKSHKNSLMYDFLLMDNQIPYFVLNELLRVCPHLNAFIGCTIEDLALSCFKKIAPKMNKDKKKLRTEFLHLLDTFHWSRIPKDKYSKNLSVPVKNSVTNPNGPRAMKLHDHGMKFKKKKSGCALEITIKESFSKKYNMINIAKMNFDNSQFYLLESLSMFELRYRKRGYYFNDFIECMTNLLQCGDDVELLRNSGIIPTKKKVSNDYAVSFFSRFKQLC
ncbi:hypothetical protein LUZ60_008063 [Juncus effusus]|nr:hypothetical protein LUZ60_008063 [Juncus effusus]